MIGAARGALAEAEAQCVASQQLGALAYLHAQGVVHLDVKPQNILCHEPMSDVAADPLDGVHTKLLDFGFARVLLLARGPLPARRAAAALTRECSRAQLLPPAASDEDEVEVPRAGARGGKRGPRP